MAADTYLQHAQIGTYDDSLFAPVVTLPLSSSLPQSSWWASRYKSVSKTCSPGGVAGVPADSTSLLQVASDC